MTQDRQTTKFDAAEYLDTPEAQAEFLAAALESGDAPHIVAAMGTVARARGMRLSATAQHGEDGVTFRA